MSMVEPVYPTSTSTYFSDNSDIATTGAGSEEILVTTNPLPEAKKTPLSLIIVIAFFGLVIVVSGAILVMCLIGIIKFDDPKVKDQWIEINSQILNAIFTLNAFVCQPGRFMDMLRFFRRNVKDIEKLKGKYLFLHDSHPDPSLKSNRQEQQQQANSTTNEATQKNEDSRQKKPKKPWTPWQRLFLILFLLNMNCITQYPITAIMWAWASSPSTRPSIVVYCFIPFSFLSGTAAGILQYLYYKEIKEKYASKSNNNNSSQENHV